MRPVLRRLKSECLEYDLRRLLSALADHGPVLSPGSPRESEENPSSRVEGLEVAHESAASLEAVRYEEASYFNQGGLGDLKDINDHRLPLCPLGLIFKASRDAEAEDVGRNWC